MSKRIKITEGSTFRTIWEPSVIWTVTKLNTRSVYYSAVVNEKTYYGRCINPDFTAENITIVELAK